MTTGPMIPALVLLLAACSTNIAQQSAAPPPTVPPPPPCPVVRSSNWTAWVDAKGWPGKAATLHVTGRATLPWVGWRIHWKDKRVLQSTPVHVYVTLDADPPANGGTKPDVQEVSGSWPSEPAVASVTVICRDTQLAHISSVETIH